MSSPPVRLKADRKIGSDILAPVPRTTGERIVGTANFQALRSHHPGRPSGFNVRRITRQR
jgi:hypothetical protein